MRQLEKLFVAVLLVLLVGGTFLPAAAASAPASAEAEPVLPAIHTVGAIPSGRPSGPPAIRDVGAILGGRPTDSPARLLSSTEAGVTFELDVPWGELLMEPAAVEGPRQGTGGKEYVRVSLPGWPTTSQSGAPMLPQMAQPIGVPHGPLLSVQVEPGPAHTKVLPAPPLPVGTQRVKWDPATAVEPVPALPEPSYTVEEDPAIYTGGAAYPGALAEVASDGMVRQQRVAGIVAHPVQYHPDTRELTVYEWLKITVKFEGSPSDAELLPAAIGKPSSPESTAYDKLLAQELLNYDAARAWRQPSALREGGTEAGPTPWAPPVPGWRVKVRDEGFCKLTYAELQTAGLPVASLDPRTLRLYNLGSEVAIFVTGEQDGRFDSGDSLLFFGEPVVSKYTRDNVYWLTYGGITGLRMGSRSGTPGAAGTPAYHRTQRHLESNGVYVTQAPGDDELERWFWDYIFPPERPSWTHTFSLAAPYAGTYTAKLTLAMLGYLQNPTSPDHHVVISLNGTQVGDVRWDGIAWQTVEIPIAQSLLLAGDNTLTVVCPNDTGVGYDLVYIDWAELEFADTFKPVGDVLPFSYEATGPWKFQLDGFSNSQVAVYDVTDPASVARIDGIDVVKSDQTYTARFQDPVATPTRYWATATTAYRTVQAIEADTASNLRLSQNAADYILITHRAFWDQAATLRNFRAAQGLRAVQVDVQDVYDEFGYGIVGAAPIHDFLAYAYTYWQAPAPSFVLLVGDGHYDPKDYLGYGRTSYLPPYLAAIDPWIVETAADNRYVTLAGADNLPDMMLGRLAVNSSAEASAFVDKIVAYEQSPVPGEWKKQVLAVADDGDGALTFAQMSDDLLASYLPQPYQAEKVYYGVTHPTVAGARSAIQSGISAGKLVVNFIGHGAITQWANEGLFKATDTTALMNGGKLPVMLPMTCYDGYYHFPYLPSAGNDATAEVVTRAEGKGAVASWSPTGLGVATGHSYLNKGFFQALFRDPDGLVTLGEATTAGKLQVWASSAHHELLDTYLLFGDPATTLTVQAYQRLRVFLPLVLKP
jgi:hypothetical protein